MKVSVLNLHTCWTPLIVLFIYFLVYLFVFNFLKKKRAGEEDSLLGILVTEVTVSIFAH